MQFPDIEKNVVEKYLTKINGIDIDTLFPEGENTQHGYPIHELVFSDGAEFHGLCKSIDIVFFILFVLA